MYTESGHEALDPAEDKRRRKAWIVVSIVSLAIIVVGVGVLIFAANDEVTDTATGTEVEEANETPSTSAPVSIPIVFNGADSTDDDPSFERADEVGEDPFVSPQDLVDEFEVSFEDETPYGLFGGTLENTCDPARLADFLEANPDKGQEWARIQGIRFSQLRSYITGLTPAVLQVDTAVTNHGFKNGVAVPIVATLEAGTAVLVDSEGVPRARCYCGNPLTPPPPPPPPTGDCLPSGVPLWIKLGGQLALGSPNHLVTPRPWKVAVVGSPLNVGGVAYVELDPSFQTGWVFSAGGGGYEEIWIEQAVLTAADCEPTPVCYGGWTVSYDSAPPTQSAPLTFAPTNAVFTGSTTQFQGQTWYQLQIITVSYEPVFNFVWVPDNSVMTGSCETGNICLGEVGFEVRTFPIPGDLNNTQSWGTDQLNVTTTGNSVYTPAGDTFAEVQFTNPFDGSLVTTFASLYSSRPGVCGSACTLGAFDGTNRTIKATFSAEFDGQQGLDYAYVYEENGSTFLQFELAGQTQVSSALDLGPNINGGARNVIAIRADVPVTQSVSILLLHDESTAGGAGGGGSTLFADLADCQPRSFGERYESFTAGTVDYISCQNLPGGTAFANAFGTMNALGTGLDHAIQELDFDPASGSMAPGAVTNIQHPQTPPPPCF